MTYIDNIKDDILKVCAVRELDMKFLREKLLSSSSYEFMQKVNFRANRTNPHFMYRYITITTKSGNIYNIAWNFKKEFPVYIISKTAWKSEKLLDEDFCISTDEIPENMIELLEEFKETYLPDDVKPLK